MADQNPLSVDPTQFQKLSSTQPPPDGVPAIGLCANQPNGGP